MPGYITKYDSAKHTATVQPGVDRVYFDGKSDKMALLLDVPVLTLQGGGAAGVHFGAPVAVGDECLVIFADTNIDGWFQNGGHQLPMTSRQHNLSDSFAIVGFNSLAGLAGWTTPLGTTEGGVGQTGGNARVAVDSDSGLVAISSATKTLATVLGNLVTALEGLKVVDSGTTAVPAGSWGIDPATLVLLQTVAADLALLLKS